MGEATYYLKARFESEQSLQEALPRIEEFLKESKKAEDYWQKNRDKVPSEFWPEFKRQFSQVYKYLGNPLITNDCDNGLAGRLSYTDLDGNIELKAEGPVMKYCAHVWHFADWELFAAFLESEFGATDTNYLSDEYINPFDALEI